MRPLPQAVSLAFCETQQGRASIIFDIIIIDNFMLSVINFKVNR
jgi:hypothetical protein